MSRVRSLLFTLAAFMLASGLASAKSFTSKEGRFSASLPADPVLKNTTVESPTGSMVIHNYTIDTKDGPLIVGYFDLPTGVPPADRVDAILDGAANGMVSNTKGKLLKSEKLEVAGCPAREILWSFRSNNLDVQGRSRLILVGARSYQVMVLGKEPFVASKPVTDFLKTFKFDPAPPVKPDAPPEVSKPVPIEPMPTPAPTDSPAEWRAFNTKNNDGGYTVQVPAKPEKGQAPGILGVKNRTVFTCSAEGLTFTIMGQPVPATAQKDGPAVLAASRDALVKAHRGKASTEESLHVGEFPAREFRVTSASLRPNVILARSVLAGKRLYTLFVMGPEAAVSGPSARKFLDSFTPKQ